MPSGDCFPLFAIFHVLIGEEWDLHRDADIIFIFLVSRKRFVSILNEKRHMRKPCYKIMSIFSALLTRLTFTRSRSQIPELC